MNYYNNIQVIKLREYSRAYGGQQTINYAYGIEGPREWLFFDQRGQHARTMRKGTKLLMSVHGNPMTEQAFNKRMEELDALRERERLQAIERQKQEQETARRLLFQTIDYIKSRVRREQAVDWVSRFKDGNAKQRNRKWANKAVQIGLSESDSRTLRDVCKEMAM